MKQYLDLLQDVITSGTDKGDRTGTGTRSVFGRQMRFDLADGFPLVTTKKVFLKGIIHELLWFLSGSVNCNDLPESTKPWWTPWAAPDGDLGAIYGQQYRRSRWWFQVKPMVFEPPVVVTKPGLFCGVGDLGALRRKTGTGPQPEEPSHVTMLKDVWRDMLVRCYRVGARGYDGYGGVGVHVCEEWKVFENFVRDAQKLPGWALKLEYPSEYSLDKDIRCASNRYGPDTCKWASRAEQGWNTSTNRPFYATPPGGGQELLFPSIGEMVRLHNLNVSAVHRCLNGGLHTHHGWSNFRYLDPADLVTRFTETDQLKNLIASLKHSPNSRRHLVNLWHTPAMEFTQLPCCHGSVIQFYVANGKLSCQIYQRSADLFIGVPVNIASYALFTMMVAQVCGYAPGDFIWAGGDCHIYSNHFDQVALQLSREPKPLPTMHINPFVDDIFAFKYEDFVLEGYDPHPTIRGEVAV